MGPACYEMLAGLASSSILHEGHIIGGLAPEGSSMRKCWILCCLLLLSLVPLACSENEEENEWRDVAKFANYKVEYYEGLPFAEVSENSTLTEPFSVHENKLQIFCVSGFSGAASGSDNVALPVREPGTLIIDLYHYPDMEFVKTAVDDEWTTAAFPDFGKYSSVANVEKGMYCLYVAGSNVTWAVTVSECLGAS